MSEKKKFSFFLEETGYIYREGGGIVEYYSMIRRCWDFSSLIDFKEIPELLLSKRLVIIPEEEVVFLL